jgi:hypothetical protein
MRERIWDVCPSVFLFDYELNVCEVEAFLNGLDT